MTLEQYAYLAEILGVVVVIVTLIYLSVQIRQGAELLRSESRQAQGANDQNGVYRIIDFTLSNCINSGLRRMLVLTQYKGASLDRHINLGWRFLCRELDEFIVPERPEEAPPGEDADAVTLQRTLSQKDAEQSDGARPKFALETPQPVAKPTLPSIG